MCLNYIYSEVHEGKHLSDSFPTQYGLKQSDALSPLLSNFALGYANRNIRENQVQVKLNGTHQLLAYTDDVNLLGDNITMWSRVPFEKSPAFYGTQRFITAFTRTLHRIYPEPDQSRRMASSGMLCHVALVRMDVSEELGASIIRVTRIGELGMMLAVTSNRRMLRRNTK
jgi:hypothetical protein